MKHIHSYYSPNDLYNKIIEGLNKIGKDLSKVTLDDLQPVDEFHIRGDVATKELIKLSNFTPDMHIPGYLSKSARNSLVLSSVLTWTRVAGYLPGW